MGKGGRLEGGGLSESRIRRITRIGRDVKVAGGHSDDREWRSNWAGSRGVEVKVFTIALAIHSVDPTGRMGS